MKGWNAEKVPKGRKMGNSLVYNKSNTGETVGREIGGGETQTGEIILLI